MRRPPHENVATVLVDPAVLPGLELDLMALDLWVWPLATAPTVEDGPRLAFQVRRRLIEARRGDWDCARGWTPVWISFGPSWYDGDEPLPWSAHRTLWDALGRHAEHVRHTVRLGGVPRLPVRHERGARQDTA
ncbi:hypothetical protein [Nocardioides marmotae]|uniref:hypothetical protein n=1 Tax=Nocardioides marmotae TaxID=2663857 RepID=UPI0012B55FE2|nr:hypothetical protein [Nocardioides marmotae]MBC9732769.1 hypothetical protein [Nocardioides marmotae]MTB83884.1 hypothetical protein [Nocardioides marmotae]